MPGQTKGMSLRMAACKDSVNGSFQQRRREFSFGGCWAGLDVEGKCSSSC